MEKTKLFQAPTEP